MFNYGTTPKDVGTLWPWLRETFTSLQGHVNGFETRQRGLKFFGTAEIDLANSTFDVYQHIDNDLVEIWISLTFGSSVSFADTGTWKFELPRTPRVRAIGEARFIDSSTNIGYVGNSLAATDGFLYFLSDNTAAAVSKSAPYTWASTDVLLAHIRYLSSASL